MAPQSARGSRRRPPDLLRRVPASLLALALVAMVILAFGNPGMATTRVDVNDGGIWVTNESLQLAGHLNYEARTLDAALRTGTADFDIAQHRDTVTFQDATARSIAAVDPAGVRLGSATTLPEHTQAVQGGERAAGFGCGQLCGWRTPGRRAGVADESSALATDLTAVWSRQGGRHGGGDVRTERTFVRGGRRYRAATRTPITGLSQTARISLTMVGSRPVGLIRRQHPGASGRHPARPLRPRGPEASAAARPRDRPRPDRHRDGAGVCPLSGGPPTELSALGSAVRPHR